MTGQLSLFDLVEQPARVGETVFFTEGMTVVKATVESLTAPGLHEKHITVRTKRKEKYYIVKFFRNKQMAAEEIKKHWKGKINYR